MIFIKSPIFRRSFLNSLRKFATASENNGECTALYDFHVANGGKMVNFGGYLLPVQYSDQGITASHLHTRQKASLFDVSHMLQTEIKGPECIKFMESLCTADLINLPNNSSTLTVFTNQQGGILDDLIITKINNNHLYIVSNAAMKQQDKKIMLDGLQSYKNIDVKFFEPLERGLIALQGPKSQEVLQKFTDIKLSDLYFMQSREATVCGSGACRITRCGYTGEDGFEISIPSIKIVDISRELIKDENVKLAGLGARDSLRLEAGLCLYGNDITPTTTPVEAGLTWLVAKNRRTPETSTFPGAETILNQIKNGSNRKRVGLVVEAGGPPARHNTPIVNVTDGKEIGVVTSGCPSPSLNKNISMGYVPTEMSKVGNRVGLKIREKIYGAVVTKMPFVKANYYNKPK